MPATTYPITEEPNPSPEHNIIPSYNVRWISAKGRKSGNSRPSLLAAQNLARKVASEGAMEISITKRWIAGYVF